MRNSRCALFALSPLQGPPFAPPCLTWVWCVFTPRTCVGGWGSSFGEALSVVEDTCRALGSAQGLHLCFLLFHLSVEFK